MKNIPGGESRSRGKEWGLESMVKLERERLA